MSQALEAEARVRRQVGEVGEVAGVGEQVDRDERARRAAGIAVDAERLAHEVGADEAGRAGDEQPHRAMLAHRHARSPAPGNRRQK